MSFNQERKLAQEIASKVGNFLKRSFNDFDRSKGYKFKSKDNIQTWVDLAAEKIILQKIKKAFPRHHVLSEESGENHLRSDYSWIIDPLDGTTNFAMHLPAYGTSIALAYMNKVVLGVTYTPSVNELIVAETGKGTYCNQKKVRVSEVKDLKRALLTFCHGSMFHDIKRAVKLYSKFKLRSFDYRQIGSTVVEFNFVASGRTEAIMLPGANLYDVAAGALIVKEAGGKVTDFKNKAWTIHSRDILASNGLAHQEILKVINGN
jgi:myo-inositol-1(or 4)-monophosphatase